ncbi:MAG TPA: trypsin-like peptidase domain-containing protein [Thermomicrobiales bacterium]|nr:trypsin-like peptidase domain-containing protein [Thermomicrobiales bacterium]
MAVSARQSSKVLIAIVLALGVLLSALQFGTATRSPDSQDHVLAAREAQDDSEDMDIDDLVEEVNPAVVTVFNLTSLENMGATETITQGAGTGFVIDAEGYIVTNWHVVTTGDEFAVQLYDGTLVEAELIGTDARDDLAVVKIDSSEVISVVELGDSDALRPGETVVAIGSPLGQFPNTVTAGIVSALGRDGFGGLSNCQNYSNLIQHDAAINPGNSGGPLFNLQGEVVGVNTLGLPLSEDGTPIQGLYFAVPSNLVATISQQLIQDGQITAPYLGITNQPITEGEFAANNLEYPGGVLITDIGEGTPAEDAGLQVDDVILKINGEQITVERGLAAIMLDYQPGDEITVTVLRDGREMDIQLILGNLPQEVLDSCQLVP